MWEIYLNSGWMHVQLPLMLHLTILQTAFDYVTKSVPKSRLSVPENSNGIKIKFHQNHLSKLG